MTSRNFALLIALLFSGAPPAVAQGADGGSGSSGGNSAGSANSGTAAGSSTSSGVGSTTSSRPSGAQTGASSRPSGGKPDKKIGTSANGKPIGSRGSGPGSPEQPY
jgi:hypothetical protein